MKRRVSDRAILRCLKRNGVDVEGVRSAIAADTPPRCLALVQVDVIEPGAAPEVATARLRPWRWRR